MEPENSVDNVSTTAPIINAVWTCQTHER